MRQIAAILLIWPITVLGEAPPDALPPWGVWECSVEVGFECNWSKPDKQPRCELTPKKDLKDSVFSQGTFRVDFESMPIKLISLDDDETVKHQLYRATMGYVDSGYTRITHGSYWNISLGRIL